MKKILSLMVVTILLLNMCLPCFAQGISWSKASDWALLELEKAKTNDLIPESLNNQDLTKNVSREEFAEIAVKVYEALSYKKAEVPATNPFKDTENPEILKAYNLGITNGTTENTFEPDEILTREQAATMLTRTYMKSFKLEKLPEINIENKFADHNKISGWAVESVYFMASNGIIAGIGNNKFAPTYETEKDISESYGTATREQALLIAVRVVEKFRTTSEDAEKPPVVTDKIENVIDESKENYTIAFIGGSLTEGGSYTWINTVKEMFQEKYPDKNIVIYNAGCGGTTSVLGAVRYGEDVLKFDPDLVFIEFAANDYYLDENTANIYMEAMVRQSLSHKKIPAILFLYAPRPVKEDSDMYGYWKRSVDAKEKVAKRYEIKSINIYDYMVRDYKKMLTEKPGLDFFEDYLGEYYKKTSPAEYDVHGGYEKYSEAIKEAFDEGFDKCITVPKKVTTVTDSRIASLKYRYIYANSGKVRYLSEWTTYKKDNLSLLNGSAHVFDYRRVEHPYFPNGIAQTTKDGAAFGYESTPGTKAIALGFIGSASGADATVYIDEQEVGTVSVNVGYNGLKEVTDWIELPDDKKSHKIIFKVKNALNGINVFRFGSIIERY